MDWLLVERFDEVNTCNVHFIKFLSKNTQYQIKKQSVKIASFVLKWHVTCIFLGGIGEAGTGTNETNETNVTYGTGTWDMGLGLWDMDVGF